MYHEFYHLSTDPFRLSPDHRFCFGHRSFKRARTYMEYALDRGEGFVMVTGEPGTGKSTLIEDLFAGLQGEPVVKAKLVSTQLYAEDLLRMVAFSFGVDAEGVDKATLLKRLTDFFIQQRRGNRRVLLVVDEAQDLPPIALEELRLLTNLQEDSAPLLQIFLIGQQELRDQIHSRDMEQVHQRIVAACHLEPLKLEETRAYIEHRLHCTGWENDPCISDAAFYIIQHFSRGVPRRINLICSRLFLHGSVEELHKFLTKDVRVVLQELYQERLISRGGLTREVIEMLADVPPAIRDDCAPTMSRGEQEPVDEQPATPALLQQTEIVADASAPVDDSGSEVAPETAEEVAHAADIGVQPESVTVASDSEPVSVGEQTASAVHDVPPASQREKSNWIGGVLVTLVVLALVGLLAYQLQPDAFQAMWQSLREPARESTTNNRQAVSAPAEDTTTATKGADVTSSSPPDGSLEVTADQLEQSSSPEPQRSDDMATAGQAMPSPSETSEPTEPVQDNEQVTETLSQQITGEEDVDHREGAEGTAIPASVEPEETIVAVEADQDQPRRQLDDIERDLAALDLPVGRTENGAIEVNLRNAVPFASGSAEINADSREILDQLANILRPYDGIALRIVGHTDRSGDEGYNLILSERRAAAVANYLREVAGERLPLGVEGKGSSDPVVPHDSADRKLNRRTVLYIDYVREG